MSGYVITRKGTFGKVKRRYEVQGVPMVIVKWGPLSWLTPVREADVHLLSSRYEEEARKEAEEWLKSAQTSLA